MILGVCATGLHDGNLKQDLLRATERMSQGSGGPRPTVWANSHVAFCSMPLGIDTFDEFPQPFVNADGTIVVMFEGKSYNHAEIKRLLGPGRGFQTDCSGEALVHLCAKYRENLLNRVNGKYAFALWGGKPEAHTRTRPLRHRIVILL
jgi:asparagine synthase (glutamine-hydrolysing)